MFLDATKLALVEGWRQVFDNDSFPGPKPRKVDIEYPMQEIDWPAVLVQFHPATIEWTGLNPTMYTPITDPTFSWEGVRAGHFEGSADFSIMALTSAERDRIYDAMLGVVMMGDMSAVTSPFWQSLNNHDLIAMSFQPSKVQPVSDSIQQGAPWDDRVLIYEGSVRIQVIGEFYADMYTQQLLAISAVESYAYRADEPVPLEGDGRGNWVG